MVTITVTAGNLPPVAEGPPADAGPPLTVAPGALVQFDGPVSSDSGETIMSWDWSRTGGTGDSNVNLIGAEYGATKLHGTCAEPRRCCRDPCLYPAGDV